MLAASREDLEARVEALEAENQRLLDRNQALEELVGAKVAWLPPPDWRLTGSETRIIAALMAREMCSKEQLLGALHEPGADDEPHIKIVDVFICKARKKLKPFDVEIETIWGRGYRMTPAMKAKAREQIAAWNQED